MHKIKVMSIPDLIRAKEYVNKGTHYIVQIQHHGKNDYPIIEYSNTIKNITLVFDDVNKDDTGFIDIYDVGKANAVAELIGLIDDDNNTSVYVCCYGGLSRSPAVAMAIMCYLIDNGHSEYKPMLEDCWKTHPHFNIDVVEAILNMGKGKELTKEVDYKCPLCHKQNQMKNVDMNKEYYCNYCRYKLTNNDIVAHTLGEIKGFPDPDLELNWGKNKKKHWWRKND